MCHTISVPATLRNQKLALVVEEIVNHVENNEVVLVKNKDEYTNAVVEAVEQSKNQLLNKGIRMFQSNNLEYDPVYNEGVPESPLKKSTIHHYKTVLSIKLSRTPIDSVDADDTQQICEPKPNKVS